MAMTFTRYLNKRKTTLSPSSKQATDAFFAVMGRNRDFPEEGPRMAPGKTFLIDHMVEQAKTWGNFDSYLSKKKIVLRPWQKEASDAFFAVVGQGSDHTLIAERQGIQSVVGLMKDFIRDHGNVFEV